MFRFSRIILLCLIAGMMISSVTAAPGDTIKTVPAPYTCPIGLAHDGDNLWAVDRRSDMIYQIDPGNGQIMDSIPSPGYSPQGLAWDGVRLWIVDGEEGSIYAINPESRIVEQTIWCPASKPVGLAWDGQYLWVADESTDQLLQISSEDGTTIVSITAPSSHPAGLAFDGSHLWVSDRYANMIYMVTPDNGDVIISFDSPGPHSLGLAFDGSNIWNVDYQTDLIYQLVVDDNTPFVRLKEKHQHLDFIHQARNYGPDSVKTLDVYLAIPQTLNNQELDGEVTFTPEPTDILTDKWGQEVAHYHFTDLAAGEFTEAMMSVSAKLYQNRYYIFPDKVGGVDDVPNEIRELYLVDDAKFKLTDPIIAEGVEKALEGETNLYWIGRKLFNYVIDKVEYELVGGWNIAPTVLDRGTGSCSEYSFVYIAMCRAAGLPARYAGSVAVRSDDASYDNVFHRWVEIYLPGYGWIPVDPSRGDSEWPSKRANSFGYLNNTLLITTLGGGGSEYLEWSYNGNERWTSKGRAKVVSENFGEWTPIEEGE